MPNFQPEPILTVKRGDVSEVERVSVTGARAGFIITGATGSGKSTFGLLPIICKAKRARLRVLLVQPTPVNVGNILEEFLSTMVNLVARYFPQYFEYPRPKHIISEFDIGTTDYFCVMDAQSYYHAMKSARFMRMFAVIAVDEYHLALQYVVSAVTRLRHDGAAPKYLFISATPEGRTAPTSFGSKVIPREVHAPLSYLEATDSTFRTSVYNPDNFRDWGNQCVTYVMPTLTVAQRYQERLAGMGISAHVVSEETSAERYREVLSGIRREPFVVILTPKVEAGVTVPMSVLVDTCATYNIEYKDGVVYEGVTQMDAAAAVQRAGRVGRNFMAVYVRNTSPTDTVAGDARIYFQANALVQLLAAGVDAREKYQNVLQTFPGLATLSQRQAECAVDDIELDPLVAAYRYSQEGELYKEAGGEAEGFEKAHLDDCRVYYWDGGICVCTVFSLVNLEFRPETMLDAAYHGRLVEKLLDKHKDKVEATSDADRFELVRRNLNVFSGEILRTLVKITKQERRHWSVGDRAATLEQLFNTTDFDMAGLIGDIGKMPGNKLIVNQVRGGGMSSAAYALRTSRQIIELNPADEYLSNHKLDKQKFAAAIVEGLRDKINIAALSRVGNLAINLNDFAKFAPTGHKWFDTHVRGRQPLDVEDTSRYGKVFEEKSETSSLMSGTASGSAYKGKLISEEKYLERLAATGIAGKYPDLYKSVLDLPREHIAKALITLTGEYAKCRQDLQNAKPGTFQLIQKKGLKEEWDCTFKCFVAGLYRLQEYAGKQKQTTEGQSSKDGGQ